MWLIYVRCVLTVFILGFGYGVVSPRLLSLPSDFAVLFSLINMVIIIPFILWIIWKDQFRAGNP